MFGRPNKRIARNKAACFVSALTSVLFVALLGFLCLVLWQFIAIIFNMDIYELNNALGINDTGSFFGGVGVAVFLSAFNWYLGMIVVPIAWFFISQVTGRLPHRGISKFSAYFWRTGITGAVLVGGTCGLGLLIFGMSETRDPLNAFMMASGALLMGGLIGLGAGLVVGSIHYLIIRPKNQLENSEMAMAEVFE